MNKKLLDILVCPFDKITALDLLEFETESKSQDRSESSNLDIIQDEEAKESQTQTRESVDSTIIKEGMLLCKTCNRFYPITEEIPIILPDELRDKKKDLEFLKKWKDAVPSDLLSKLKPWSV